MPGPTRLIYQDDTILAPRTMSTPEWGLLLLLGMMWGASFYFTAIILRHCPLLLLMWGRVTVGALLLAIVARLQRLSVPVDPLVWRDFVVLGLLNNMVPFALTFWCVERGLIGAGLAAALNSTTPLFSALLGHFVTRKEPLTLLRIIGIGLGIAGVAAIAGPEALAGKTVHVLGVIGITTGALCYAVGGLWGKRFAELPPTITAIGQFASSSVVLFPFALFFTRPWSLPPMPLETIQAFIALTMLSTAVAYMLFFHLLRTVGPTNTLLVTLLVPVFALLLSVVFLHERFTVLQGIGMGLIAVGLGVIAVGSRERPSVSVDE